MINIKILLNNIRTFVLKLWIALFIVSYFNIVSIYDLESRYQFVLTWSSASITNRFEFYIFPFIVNVLICYLLISLCFKIKVIQKITYGYFVSLILIFILSYYMLGVVGKFIIFGASIYFWEQPIRDFGDSIHLYCQYLSFADNENLNIGLCGREN
jgi:hypothetical protein